MNNINRAILKLLSLVGIIITTLGIIILVILQATNRISINGGEWLFAISFSEMFWIIFLKLNNSINND